MSDLTTEEIDIPLEWTLNRYDSTKHVSQFCVANFDLVQPLAERFQQSERSTRNVACDIGLDVKHNGLFISFY